MTRTKRPRARPKASAAAAATSDAGGASDAEMGATAAAAALATAAAAVTDDEDAAPPPSPGGSESAWDAEGGAPESSSSSEQASDDDASEESGVARRKKKKAVAARAKKAGTVPMTSRRPAGAAGAPKRTPQNAARPTPRGRFAPAWNSPAEPEEHTAEEFFLSNLEVLGCAQRRRAEPRGHGPAPRRPSDSRRVSQGRQPGRCCAHGRSRAGRERYRRVRGKDR